MKHRTNIRLDDQAREDAQRIAKEYGLGSVSAAVRFALRQLAKQTTIDQDTDQDTIAQAQSDKGATTGDEKSTGKP